MKITKIFLTSTIFLFSFFLATNFASADEVTGSITVTVAPPVATVDVKVDTVDGPITKYTGDSVAVTWTTSPSVTSCSCQCQNSSGVAISCGGDTTSKSCGSGIGRDVKSTPPTITNLVEPTIFKVTCN